MPISFVSLSVLPGFGEFLNCSSSVSAGDDGFTPRGEVGRGGSLSGTGEARGKGELGKCKWCGVGRSS